MGLHILFEQYGDAILFFFLSLQTVILSLGIPDVAYNWWSAC